MATPLPNLTGSGGTQAATGAPSSSDSGNVFIVQGSATGATSGTGAPSWGKWVLLIALIAVAWWGYRHFKV